MSSEREAERASPTTTGLIGGVEARTLVLSPHRPDWATAYRAHAARIAAALEDRALAVEHIGSTAVPALAAKPIVDALLVVADANEEPAYLPALERAGYALRVREPEHHGHRMLRTPDRAFHLHVFPAGAPEIERYLLFRDRLRRNPADRRRYEDVKRALIEAGATDMNAYARGKSEIVEALIAAERRERG